MFKIKFKSLENDNLDFNDFIKVSYHFRFYIILLFIITLIITFLYQNNKYPSKLYTQNVYFTEHISSVMHNEVLKLSSARVLELISFNELYQIDKKINSLIEKNIFSENSSEQDNYDRFKKDLFDLRFYEFSIFDKFQNLIILRVESNLDEYKYDKDLKKIYNSNEYFKINKMLGELKIISSKKGKNKENLIIRLESEDEFSTEEVNNLINYLTDAANLLMLYEINEFIEVSDNFNNELKILSERIINKRIDLFQNILNEKSSTESNKLNNDLLEIVSKINNDNDSYDLAIKSFFDFIELLKANLSNKDYRDDSFNFFSIQFGEKNTKNYTTEIYSKVIVISIFLLIFYSLIFYIINFLYFIKNFKNWNLI